MSKKEDNIINIKTSKDFREYTEEEYNNMCKQNNNIFAVRCENVLSLYGKLKPYVNKADKHGIPYSITELGTATVKKEECLIIEVDFQIKVGNWQFVATIDHLGSGNIIKSVKGVSDLPEEYRTAKNTTCDHCGTLRYRTQTFVVQNVETGEYKQVGRQCLKVYTGIDLSDIAIAFDVCNMCYNCEECGGSDDFWGDYIGFSGGRINFVSTTIALAWDIVSLYGYIKKGKENSTINSYYKFESFLEGDLRKYQPREHRRMEELLEEKGIKLLSDDSYAKAKEIIEYVLAQKVNSDYMNNMHVLLQNDTFKRQYLAFIISSVSVYLRGKQLEEEYNKKHAEEKISEHVGNVGDRITFKIKDGCCVTSWTNEWGTTYIYKFTDMDNNIYTWKTSKVVNERGAETLTGTVKAHNEYRGAKQTELTRCKVAVA
jgi:hypothetical protein